MLFAWLRKRSGRATATAPVAMRPLPVSINPNVGADDDFSDLEGGEADRGDELGEAKDGGLGEAKDDGPDEGGESGEAKDDGEPGEAKDDDDANGEPGEAKDDDDADGEPGEAKDDGEKPRERFIPRKRFDEVNDKLKAEREARLALQRKVDELTGAKVGEDPDKELREQIDALQDQYEEALMDGDKEKAKGVRQQLRQAEGELIDRVAARRAQEARSAAPEDVQLQLTVDELKAKYPVFDANSDEYNDELNEAAISLARTYVGRGMSRVQALKKAVGVVVKAHDIKAADEQDVPGDDDAGEETSEKKSVPKQPSKQPTADQRKKKLDLAQKQPPKGAPNAKEEPVTPKAAEMTDEEFDALPESKKRALRGDML